MNELVIPPAAQRDAQSLELMRAWVAEEELHCSLRIGVYEDQGISEEKAWGLFLPTQRVTSPTPWVPQPIRTVARHFAKYARTLKLS
jgi:hypothetical protein